jgi:hypothetical protein
MRLLTERICFFPGNQFPAGEVIRSRLSTGESALTGSESGRPLNIPGCHEASVVVRGFQEELGILGRQGVSAIAQRGVRRSAFVVDYGLLARSSPVVQCL